MKRVFVGGTTGSTTWREDFIERLIARGVPEQSIMNPHLPAGVSWTPEHMAIEDAVKADTETIVLLYICRADDRELLGPTTMFEIGKFSYMASQRTAVVLDIGSFTSNGRAAKVLRKLARELRADFGHDSNGGVNPAFGYEPPWFINLAAAEDWIVTQLGR